MTVKSYEIGKAPIQRSEIEKTLPVLRLITGGCFVGYSIISTILIIHNLVSPVASPYVSYGAGLLVSIIVAWAEWATARGGEKVYWGIVLILDAPFTAYFTVSWVNGLIAAHLGTEAVSAHAIMVWAWSMLFGVASAVLGELILLGGRRRGA
jgi:hypothetical protein